MHWLILIASAIFEAVWATALGASEGFTQLGPIIVFCIALVFSMYGLSLALRGIPLGTAYAAWTGIGAALTVLYAIFTGNEPVSALKLVFLGGIIFSVAGLKLVE